MTMIKAVIADFDGTLCDTQRAISAVLSATFRARGKAVPPAAEIDATIARGITLEDTFAALAPELGRSADDCQAWVKLYREIYNGGLGVQSTTAFPDAGKALEALAALGVPVVIVSNKGERAVENTLRHLGLERHVHTVVAASGTLATKPDPRSFDTRIAPLFPGIEPAEFLVVGDTPTDIRYARAIGAQVAWASFGYGAPDHCRSLEPDHVIEQQPALAELVARARDGMPVIRHSPEVTILDEVGRNGPASPILTYLRAFRQAGIPRERAQRMVAFMTRHLLSAAAAELAPPDLLVPVARAGMAMWPVASAQLGSPPCCFAIAKKDKAARTVEVQLSSGPTGAERSLLIVDTVSATGDTVVAVAAALRQRCPHSRIEVAICYASPEAVAAISGSPVVDRLVVGTLAAGVDGGWLVPRTNGDVGDKLFGAAATPAAVPA
jgi:phosphoglycolate phosphatase